MESRISMLEFIKSRQNIHYKQVPRKVLAFYYTWYGRPENQGRWLHWSDVKPDEHDIASSTHYPAKGAYDSHDPEIINYHIDLAKRNGVDAFICTWWGQGRFDDHAFGKVLDIGEKHNFEATIYWETAPGKDEAKIAQAVNDLMYVLQKYAHHKAFLRLDGKPVIFVYGRVMEQVSISEWQEIITRTRQKYDKDFILIADGYQEGYARIFDGVHTYNICGWVQGKSPEALYELSGKSFSRSVQLAKKYGKISCITIIPGYDDTKIRKPGINAERMDGETYRILWEQAIKADPDWILITSWNEWHEGSEIEPSWEHGDKYIQMTGKYGAIFKETKYSGVGIPEGKSGLSPEKREKLRNLYKGKTIGILPGYSGEVVFWLADTGISLKELTPAEIADAGIFTADKFPVVVYAGYENYIQTFKEDGDIDRAISRYLREGGTLVALPAGPFPFFYNEKGRAVNSASRFAFPIKGGWESPPEDVKLSFHIDNNILKGLPVAAPFPSTGDLRWRPGSEEGTPKGDTYTSLAKLKDEAGKDYGDGIFFIHRKNSGKNIYAWMGMTEVLDRNDVLYAIFELALPDKGME